MKIPLPNTGGQPSSTPGFSAPGTEPLRSYTGSALQSVGEGLQRAGSAVSMIERLHDEGKSTEAVGALMDALNTDIYDPTTGYHGKIGQDAIAGQDEEAMRGVTEKLVRLRNGLSNSRQRELFEREATNLMRRAELDVGQWKSKQTVAFTMGTESSAVQSNAKAAARSVGTPDFDEYLAKMGEHRDRLTTLEGFAPDSDYGNLQRMEEVTRVHASAVQAMVAGGRPTDAAEHLKKYGEQIDPQARAKLGEVVQQANDDKISLDTSLRHGASGKPLMAQFADLKAEYEGQKLTAGQFKAAWSLMRQNDAELQQQDAQAKATLLQDVKNRLMKSGGTVDSLDPETKRALVDAKLDGVVRSFEMGGKPKLTTVGMHFRYGAADEELRSMSEAQVINTLSGHMPEDDLGAVLTRWKVVTGQGSDEDAVKQDADLLIQIGAKDAGYLPDLRVGATLSSLQPDVAEKLTRYGITVRDRVRANLKPGEKPTTQHYRDAIEELKGERLKDNTPVALATPAQLQAGAFETPFGDVDVQHLVGLDGQGTPEAMRILADLQADEDQAAVIDGRRPRKLGLRDAVEEFARSTQAKNVEAQQDTRNLRERGLEYFRQLYRNNAARVDLSRYGDPYQASSVIIGQILRPQMGEVKRRPPNIAQRFRGEPGTPYANEVNQLIFAYGITYEEAAAAMREASGLSEPQGRIGVERQRMDPKDVGEIAGSVVTFPTAEMPR